MMKVEATAYGDRKVFSVSAFNRGVATWLHRLPTVLEGDLDELIDALVSAEEADRLQRVEN